MGESAKRSEITTQKGVFGMEESVTGLDQMSTELQMGLLLVLAVAMVLFYSASKKFMRYFKAQKNKAD